MFNQSLSPELIQSVLTNGRPSERVAPTNTVIQANLPELVRTTPYLHANLRLAGKSIAKAREAGRVRANIGADNFRTECGITYCLPQLSADSITDPFEYELYRLAFEYAGWTTRDAVPLTSDAIDKITAIARDAAKTYAASLRNKLELVNAPAHEQLTLS